MSDAALVLDNVCKSYREAGGARQVLDGVSVRLADGERVALMGRSGSGKSTLLHCLGGVDLPDSGQVLVAGQDLATASEAERARLRSRHLGYVFQQLNLIPTLTVLENALLRSDLAGHDDAAHRRRAQALLERVGLGERGDSLPERLSGGEQQRVAIVAALVHRPRLLLADEPTGSLDARSGAAVLDLLIELQEEEGCSLVIATHDPAVAARCPRRWELAEGRLQATATTGPGAGAQA